MLKRMSLKRLSLALFVVSLFLPAFSSPQPMKGMNFGVICLLFGWILLPGLGFFTWLANLLFFALLLPEDLLCKRRYYRPAIAVAALLLAVTGFGIAQIPISSKPDFADVRVSWGFYFWSGSYLTMLLHVLMTSRDKQAIPVEKRD